MTTPPDKPVSDEIAEARKSTDAYAQEKFREVYETAAGLRFVGYIEAERSLADARVAALEAALEPFAALGGIFKPLNIPATSPLRLECPGVWPVVGDCYRANSTLSRRST